MATLKFLLQSKSNNAPIYARLSIDAKTSFKRKTREFIDPIFWNAKKGEPKNIVSGTKEDLERNRDLINRLKKIEAFILDEYRNRKETDIIQGEWLTEIIEAFYNGGKRTQDLDYLDIYLDYYSNEVLQFRNSRGKRITASTIEKQRTIINKLKDFAKSQKKRLKVSDYGLDLSNKFELYLEKQGISKGTIGRYIKYPKTILNHAKSIGIEINDTLQQVKGYTTETPTIFITEKELEQIKSLTFLNDTLERAKNWLIIGFYTGQRASDLFKMNTKMISEMEGFKCITLKQTKTSKGVLIPLHDEVIKVLNKYNGEFPPVFSENIESCKTIFNEALKSIAKMANLNRIEYGKKWSEEEKRFIYGNYPLYELVSSHICRRSFATHNYIKVPTPVIMAVTGHKTEKEFLNYIGKDHNEYSKEILSYWRKSQTTSEKQEEPNKQIN